MPGKRTMHALHYACIIVLTETFDGLQWQCTSQPRSLTEFLMVTLNIKYFLDLLEIWHTHPYLIIVTDYYIPLRATRFSYSESIHDDDDEEEETVPYS